MSVTFHTNSAEETIELGEKIGSLLQKGDIIALQGTLAAGKTTITKGIARALGVQDEITSPTFCLISEYEGTMPLYHMDVYRLEGGDDFINLGVEDLIYGNGVSLTDIHDRASFPKKQSFCASKQKKAQRNARLRSKTGLTGKYNESTGC